MANQLDNPPPSPALPAEGREENRADREVIALPFLKPGTPVLKLRCLADEGRVKMSLPRVLAFIRAPALPSVRCPLRRDIPRAVSSETSERGGVSPPVLPKRAYAQEPGGLRRPARKPLTLRRVRDSTDGKAGARMKPGRIPQKCPREWIQCERKAQLQNEPAKDRLRSVLRWRVRLRGVRFFWPLA